MGFATDSSSPYKGLSYCLIRLGHYHWTLSDHFHLRRTSFFKRPWHHFLCFSHALLTTLSWAVFPLFQSSDCVPDSALGSLLTPTSPTVSFTAPAEFRMLGVPNPRVSPRTGNTGQRVLGSSSPQDTYSASRWPQPHHQFTGAPHSHLGHHQVLLPGPQPSYLSPLPLHFGRAFVRTSKPLFPPQIILSTASRMPLKLAASPPLKSPLWLPQIFSSASFQVLPPSQPVISHWWKLMAQTVRWNVLEEFSVSMPLQKSHFHLLYLDIHQKQKGIKLQLNRLEIALNLEITLYRPRSAVTYFYGCIAKSCRTIMRNFNVLSVTNITFGNTQEGVSSSTYGVVERKVKMVAGLLEKFQSP